MKQENETDEEQIIKDEDLRIISNIAKTYNLSVQELGRILARKKATYPRIQILLTIDELNLIDEMAKTLRLSRSKYCSMCCHKALKEELYKNIDMLKVIRESETGNKRVHRAIISYENANEFLEMKKLANDLGTPFSSLMRYFALNIQHQNVDIHLISGDIFR